MQSGFPGKALAVLEEATRRYPESREIRLALADLYRRYAMPERSEPLYREILEENPGSERARKGHASSLRLLEAAGY